MTEDKPVEQRLAQAKPKLDAGDRHLLRLIRKDRDSHGWAKVSEAVFPFALKLPTELVETRVNENGRWIRLTNEGEIVLDWIL